MSAGVKELGLFNIGTDIDEFGGSSPSEPKASIHALRCAESELSLSSSFVSAGSSTRLMLDYWGCFSRVS